MQVKTLWIVIPAFNEATVIGQVITGLRTRYPNVVVVDDRSEDDTTSVAIAAGAVVIRHPINLGSMSFRVEREMGLTV